jgi:MFS family permease
MGGDRDRQGADGGTPEGQQRGDIAEPDASYLDVFTSSWVLVSFATFLYWLAAHALRPLLALRLDELGASEAIVGAVVALFPLASLGLAIPGGRFVDRVGLRRVLFCGLVGMALLGAAFITAASVPLIALLVAAIGVMELAVWISLQALASHGGTGRFLTKQLAVFSLAWGLGIALGPIVGGVLFDVYGFGAVGLLYLVASVVAFATVVFAPRVSGGQTSGSTPIPLRRGVTEMWASGPVKVTLLSSFVVLFVYGIKASFLPLYLARQGVSASRIGLLLSVIGVASLAVRVVLPWIQARLANGRTLLISMWLALVPMTLMPAVDGYPAWLLLGVVCGFGLGMNPPITVELMARHTAVEQRGLAMGMRLTANRVSQVVQPLMFGGLIPIVGFAGAFLSSGLLLAGVTGWAQRVRSATPELR